MSAFVIGKLVSAKTHIWAVWLAQKSVYIFGKLLSSAKLVSRWFCPICSKSLTHEQKESNDFLPPNSHAVLCTLCLLGKSSNTSAPAAAYLLSISIKLLLYQKKVVCQPHFRFFGCSFLWPQSMLLSVSHDNHKDFLQKWIFALALPTPMYLPSSIICTLKNTGRQASKSLYNK